ncbi:MAG TPA: hypothetical protein VLJ41_16950 [Segetibacter sp.]|nr:hypothetical protein [Segetibacter sp.]
MRKVIQLSSICAFTILLFSSCEAIAGIFKAGMWVGVIVVVLIVALVLWLIGKARR